MQKRITRLDAYQFDWVLLRSFLAIYRAGSVAGAARQLQLQQPTLSRQLSMLESQLGLQLFERTSRGLHATASAHQIVSFVEQMEESANRLSLSLSSYNANLNGTVRIYATQLIASSLLPPILAQIMETNPGLHIELVGTDEIPDLLSRNADIGFWINQPTQLDIVARKIGEVDVVAAASRRYLEKYGEPQQFSDLVHHRLVGHDRIDTMLKWFARFDPAFDRERFCFRTDDKASLLAAVRAGMGIGFMAQYLLDANDSELCQIMPALPLPGFALWLGTHRDIINNLLIKTVYEALIARIAPMLKPVATASLV